MVSIYHAPLSRRSRFPSAEPSRPVSQRLVPRLDRYGRDTEVPQLRTHHPKKYSPSCTLLFNSTRQRHLFNISGQELPWSGREETTQRVQGNAVVGAVISRWRHESLSSLQMRSVTLYNGSGTTWSMSSRRTRWQRSKRYSRYVMLWSIHQHGDVCSTI